MMDIRTNVWAIDTQTAGLLPKSFLQVDAPEMIEWTDLVLFPKRAQASKYLPQIKEKFPNAKLKEVGLVIP